MTTTTTIYLVTGETGEYEDYTTWNVKAFFSKSKAQRFLSECITYSDSFNHDDFYDIDHSKSPDPDIRIDYTGITYYIQEIQLIGD